MYLKFLYSNLTFLGGIISYTTNNGLRLGHSRSAQRRDRKGLARSGLNYQTESSGSSGASDRPDPIIFWVSRPGPTRWRTRPGRGRVSTHCSNIKMIYKSVLAQYLVIICISLVLSTTKISCRLTLKRNQSYAMCNLTMLMIMIVCLFHRTAKGLSRKSGLMDGG